MDIKEKEWVTIFITSVTNNISRANALGWVEKTINLPTYISVETIENYLQTKRKIEKILSDANIDDVIFHFKKLNSIERKICVDKLLDLR